MEVMINLSNYKQIINRNIFLDLDVEKYILENYNSNLIKRSETIKKIQIMILDAYNVKYEHHNEVFDYINETDFISKIIRIYDVLDYIVLKAINIKFKEVYFKKYLNEDELIIIMEAT